MSIEKIMLDTTEVAKLLGVSRRTVYTMVHEGSLPHQRVRDGGQILFHKDTIESWLRGDFDRKTVQSV